MAQTAPRNPASASRVSRMTRGWGAGHCPTGACSASQEIDEATHARLAAALDDVATLAGGLGSGPRSLSYSEMSSRAAARPAACAAAACFSVGAPGSQADTVCPLGRPLP